MKQVLLDTNVVLRLLLEDQEDHYQRAVALFNAAAEKQYRLLVGAEVLAECVFVLESFYKVSRADIARLMKRLLSHSGIYSSEMDILKDSLKLYNSHNMDILDCLIAARSQARNCSIATFDKDFKKLENIDLIHF